MENLQDAGNDLPSVQYVFLVRSVGGRWKLNTDEQMENLRQNPNGRMVVYHLLAN